MKYRVKTRNWNCRLWVLKVLQLSERWGVSRCDSYKDGDGKFYIETPRPIKAWLTWAFFMLMAGRSGGWTYLIRPGREIAGGTYKSIY